MATVITKTENRPDIQETSISSTEDPLTQRICPDEFFTAPQIERLQELMHRLQATGKPMEEALTAEEQTELKALLKAELIAATQRTAALLSKSAQ